jgi:hypothetical protein
MSNPNLDRSKAYLRKGKTMFTPVNEVGKRDVVEVFSSINAAKRHSRVLMKQGKTIVTR